MTPEITLLFQKFLAGRCSRPEAEQLLDYFLSQEGEEEMVKLIQRELDKPVVKAELEPVNGFRPSHQLEALRQRIQYNTPRSSSGIAVRYRWLPYAAAILVAVSIVTWLSLPWAPPSNHSAELSVSQDPVDVAPGGNRAILTLDNSSTIRLSESQEGIVIGDGIRYEDGTPIYENAIASSDAEPFPKYATLSTPNGGTYHITLSDGTKVWLNAASTLKYPLMFGKGERLVEVTGEVYFDVFHDEKRPFNVVSNGQTVEVLGTEFNIAAYPDQQEIRTTLVEGAVRIVNNHSPSVNQLVPGQQAVVSGGTVKVSTVNTEPYTAWKDGYFYFDNVSPHEAIQDIARWYDLQVVYEGQLSNDLVFGMVERSKPLNAVLKSFGKSGITFEVRQFGTKKHLIVKGALE